MQSARCCQWSPEMAIRKIIDTDPNAEWVARLGEDDADFRARIVSELATGRQPDAPVYLYINRRDCIERGA